jgi:hypothetical protein
MELIPSEIGMRRRDHLRIQGRDNEMTFKAYKVANTRLWFLRLICVR